MAAPDLLTIEPLLDGLGYDPDLACRHLAQADPALGGLIARVGQFTMRPTPEP